MGARVILNAANAPTGTGSAITVPNLVWLMTHNLGYETEEELNPAVWYFEDENGNEMEPVEIAYVNPNQATATWLDPVRGTWRVN
jgi:hypothetical protein